MAIACGVLTAQGPLSCKLNFGGNRDEAHQGGPTFDPRSHLSFLDIVGRGSITSLHALRTECISEFHGMRSVVN